MKKITNSDLHPLRMPIELFNAFTSNLCTVAFTESQAVYDFNTFVECLNCYISGMSGVELIWANQSKSSCLPGLWWGGSIGVSPRNPHKSKTFDTTKVWCQGFFSHHSQSEAVLISSFGSVSHTVTRQVQIPIHSYISLFYHFSTIL